MGGTLHNVKSVIDALSVGFLKPRKFQLCVKDNVRSECYGYAIMVSRGVHEGILYPQGTLFRRYVQHTGVGSHSTSSHTRVFLGPQERTSRDGSLRFCVIEGCRSQTKLPYRVSGALNRNYGLIRFRHSKRQKWWIDECHPL